MVDVWIMAPARDRRDLLLRALNPERSIRVAGIAATFPLLRSLMSESSADVAVVAGSGGDPIVTIDTARHKRVIIFDTLKPIAKRHRGKGGRHFSCPADRR